MNPTQKENDLQIIKDESIPGNGVDHSNAATVDIENAFLPPEAEDGMTRFTREVAHKLGNDAVSIEVLGPDETPLTIEVTGS